MADGSREYRTLTATKRLPPGPGPPGSLRVLAGLHRDPTAVMTDLRARHGDLVHFRIGPQHVFVVMRADLAREVLVTHQRSFKKGPGFERARIVLGNGLLTSEGDFHLRQRRMMQPAFHRRRGRRLRRHHGRRGARASATRGARASPATSPPT